MTLSGRKRSADTHCLHAQEEFPKHPDQEGSEIKRSVAHLVLPSAIIVIFFFIAFTPVDLLGCRTRDLLALSVALVSGMTGITTGLIGIRKRIRREPGLAWWMLSTVILTVPVAGLIVLA